MSVYRFLKLALTPGDTCVNFETGTNNVFFNFFEQQNPRFTPQRIHDLFTCLGKLMSLSFWNKKGLFNLTSLIIDSTYSLLN